MPDLSTQPRITPRIVSSIEQAIATRRDPAAKGQRAPDVSPADQLLHAMHTVKSARFTAAERLERKSLMSVFALSMVSLYFVGLSVWQVIYGAGLSEPANRLVTLVSDHVLDLHAGAGPDQFHERLQDQGAPHARLRAVA